MIKHVLIISTGYPNIFEPLNGIFQKEQAEALAKKNIQVGFLGICPISLKILLKKKRGYLKLFQNNEEGVNNIIFYYPNIPFIPNFMAWIALLVGTFLFKRYKKQFGLPQIIHIHGYQSGLLAKKISNQYQIPYLVTEHSSEFSENRLNKRELLLAAKVFENCDYRIAVSKYFCEVLQTKFKVAFDYVPNMVNTNLFNKREYQAPAKFKILSVGILNDNKNQILILEALKQTDDITLSIVGDGPNLEKLKLYCRENKLEDRVSFLGFLAKPDLIKEMQTCSCLAISSFKETFGVVAIEAMSMGLPVISSRCGGPESIIIEGFNGYLFDLTPDSMLQAIKTTKEKYAQFSATKIKEFIEQNFSESAICDILINIYKKLVK